MARRVLVIQGHPDAESFNQALMKSYVTGAEATDCEVKILAVRDLKFDLIAHHEAKKVELEPDLQQAQEWMTWAEHWVIFYPIWWGGMPALLKGFFDRSLTTGFAARYQDNGIPIGLLKGRSVEVYNTTDTPPIAQWWYLRGDRAQIKRNILGFCGLTVKRHQALGPLFNSTAEKRQNWLKLMEKYGQSISWTS